MEKYCCSIRFTPVSFGKFVHIEQKNKIKPKLNEMKKGQKMHVYVHRALNTKRTHTYRIQCVDCYALCIQLQCVYRLFFWWMLCEKPVFESVGYALYTVISLPTSAFRIPYSGIYVVHELWLLYKYMHKNKQTHTHKHTHATAKPIILFKYIFLWMFTKQNVLYRLLFFL